MNLDWSTLELHHIDLHFHAGTERPEDASLEDFILAAKRSGRKVVGITDHFWHFLGYSKNNRHYPGTVEGYLQLSDDIVAVRERFPDMLLLFGPEMNLIRVLTDEGLPAFTSPAVTHFIAEPHTDHWGGEEYIKAFPRVAWVRERYGLPAFLAHPIRNVISVLRQDTSLAENPPHPPLARVADPVAHTGEVFDVDIPALARASREYDVPIELNAASWHNVVASNQEWLFERYVCFYRTLLDLGAELVLGSDAHGVSFPMATGHEAMHMLGVKATDIRFLRNWME